MSPTAPLAHDDIALEFTDGTLTRRWMHSTNVDKPVGFEEYTTTSGVGSGTERVMCADRQGSVIWVTTQPRATSKPPMNTTGMARSPRRKARCSSPMATLGESMTRKVGCITTVLERMILRCEVWLRDTDVAMPRAGMLLRAGIVRRTPAALGQRLRQYQELLQTIPATIAGASIGVNFRC